MSKAYFLFLVVLLEGYIVLSAELLAIRLIIPHVGGGTDTTSIVIAAVLLPLAVGYYQGGRFKPKKNLLGNRTNIRKKLQKNILIAALILTSGLSYVFIGAFFNEFNKLYYNNGLLTTTFYCLIFLVYPVFLLAQTIPLVMHYFSEKNSSLITGKMLFFSTLGSLMGALISTLVLMATIGVHLTATVTILCLCILYVMVSKNKLSKSTMFMIFVALIAFYINAPSTLKRAEIIESNLYHTIKVKQFNNGTRVMDLNNALAAGIDKNGVSHFEYMDFINKTYIEPIASDGPKRDILVIGAGGFTLGLDDTKNNYVFVDIDGALKDIAEEHFLQKELSDNKKFIPLPIRSFLKKAQREKQKYDFIFIDTYIGNYVPEHLVTKDFFEEVKARLKLNGIVAINFVGTPSYNEKFSVNFDKTLRHVFPLISRQTVQPFDGWNLDKNAIRNIVYSYYHKESIDAKIYTDDKNTIFYDNKKPTYVTDN